MLRSRTRKNISNFKRATRIGSLPGVFSEVMLNKTEWKESLKKKNKESLAGKHFSFGNVSLELKKIFKSGRTESFETEPAMPGAI